MKWFIGFLSSSLGRKVIMALTGLFLITFLLIHLIGNLQLLKGDEGRSFNLYAEFMSTNPFIQAVSKINFSLIGIHIVWAVLLTLKNRGARAQEYLKPNKSSPWASRNMGILGFLVFLFLVVHIRHFYTEMHWGSVPLVNYGEGEVRNLHYVVAYWFDKGWYVGLYAACMAALAFHLWHGFASAFQTLGLNHVKYTPIIHITGKVFSVVVPALFASIPIIMFLT